MQRLAHETVGIYAARIDHARRSLCQTLQPRQPQLAAMIPDELDKVLSKVANPMAQALATRGSGTAVRQSLERRVEGSSGLLGPPAVPRRAEELDPIGGGKTKFAERPDHQNLLGEKKILPSFSHPPRSQIAGFWRSGSSAARREVGAAAYAR